jgi:uncharacterized protein YndB with AHSA1/START domain
MIRHKNINFIAKRGKQEVIITSLIEASRDRAWKAYTDPHLVPCWWGPRNLMTTVDKMFVVPGGEWRFVQRDSGGHEYGFHGVYREILPPEKLAYTFEYEAEPGRVVKETVTFEDRRGKTKIVERAEFGSVADRDEMLKSGMKDGAIESIDRFASMLETLEKTESDIEKAKNAGAVISITREFDAPRELVWKAWSEPERVKLWWGPKGYTAPVIKIDFCVGSRYLFCMRSPEGKDYWSTGVYKEILPLERIVATDSFADEKGSPVPASYYGREGEWAPLLLLSVTFEEANGKTLLTIDHAGHPARMIEPARAGWNESLDKLAASLLKEKE